ncbi:MAG: acylphosphatase [Erysipelotrichaceae bacterium]|nr:acylphosphatase [Erysipelotrichaceae bacterium]
MKRYYIIYSGIVQGVGFRWRLLMSAQRYGLTGYARNLDNGNVEVEVQGGPGVDEFLKDSLKEDRFIQVYDYSIKEIPLIENERKFDVKYY